MNTAAEQELEELADELGVDTELPTDEVTEYTDLDDSGSAVEIYESTVVKPVPPSTGTVRDMTYTRILDDESHVVLHVQNRFECPSCGTVVMDMELGNQLSGKCSSCSILTCPQCKNTCDGCGTIMCSTCTTGHGLVNGTYCVDCRGDVIQDVGFERGMEKRKQSHSEEMDQLEKQLKDERQAKELELKEEREEREQVRKDWRLIVDAVKAAQGEDEDSDGSDSSSTGKRGDDVFGGSGAFTGHGAFTEGKEYDYSSSEEPGFEQWMDSIENDIDNELQE